MIAIQMHSAVTQMVVSLVLVMLGLWETAIFAQVNGLIGNEISVLKISVYRLIIQLKCLAPRIEVNITN